MRFVGLALHEFVPFKDSGIQKLYATFTADIQLILGSNGSGKSSLLAMLDPTPCPKPMFGDNGYRSNLIEHNGEIYKLESDYSKTTSPHLFFEGDNDTNLNIGRTTNVQKDLIEEHLGLTPFMCDLIMNRFNFPKWTAAARREFLMAHNPADIGFILEEQKKISSSVRACRNNIARLQDRKILLEQSLLSDEAVRELEAEKAQIEKSLAFFQEQLLHIEIDRQVRSKTADDPAWFDAATRREMTTTLAYARNRMYKLKHIDRDRSARVRLKQETHGRIQSLRDKQTGLDERIATLFRDLEELEIRYRELIPDGDLAEIENTIRQLESERDNLRTTKPSYILTKDDLDLKYSQWDGIHTKLSIFQTCEVPLYSNKKRSLRERFLNSVQYRISSYQMSLQDYRKQLDELAKRHSIDPSDIPDDKCAKRACPLFSQFMDNYEHTEGRRQDLKRRVDRISHRLNRAVIYAQHCEAYFKNSEIYHNQIAWLVHEARNNPVLYHVLKNVDILTTLKSSPNLITSRLRDAYDHIDKWIKYQSVLADLETAKLIKDRCVGAQDGDTVKLIVDIDNKKKELEHLRSEIIDIGPQINYHEKLYSDIELFDSLFESVMKIKQTYGDMVDGLANNHEKTKLAVLKRGVEAIRQDAFARISDVERVLREQDTLRARYEEEVVKELERITVELKDQEHIEKALIAIPKEHTIDFVNGIFMTANRIIDMVWAIPLRIDLLDYNDKLDFSFTVSGDNDAVREMSKCSAGQSDILTLALNIALRIELKIFELPLCLDEVGATFDQRHRQNMITMLKGLIDDGVISQLFLISHHVAIHEGFTNTETLVLREDTIVLPEVYNLHCEIS